MSYLVCLRPAANGKQEQQEVVKRRCWVSGEHLATFAGPFAVACRDRAAVAVQPAASFWRQLLLFNARPSIPRRERRFVELPVEELERNAGRRRRFMVSRMRIARRLFAGALDCFIRAGGRCGPRGSSAV